MTGSSFEHTMPKQARCYEAPKPSGDSSSPLLAASWIAMRSGC